MALPPSLYRKKNSFVDIRAREDVRSNFYLDRILKASKRPELVNLLSASHQLVLSRALNDLESGSDSGEQSFQLSMSAQHEIDKLRDEDLPRYLVHRFRYEIYPVAKELDDFPPYLQIEPSSICNYRCVFCYETDKSFTRKSNGHMGHMQTNLFREIIDQAVGRVEFISLASRGEPLLCPNIQEMLAYTRDKFLGLKLNTNASLLDEHISHAILQSGVRTLVISADAASEPLYSQLRVNGKLEKVLANVRTFKKIKELHYPDSPLITRVSGVKYSVKQHLSDMENVWGELVDQVAFVSYNPWENVYESMPTEVLHPCSDLWRRMFVWWDGRVNPCDVDYKSSLAVGSLVDKSLAELWISEKYAKLRHEHQQLKRANTEPCRRCVVT
jgi:radical SAM protein with 4Fe4S-binding SPASM domain